MLPAPTANAQADPIAIIDAAYKQLSAQLGKTVVRGAQSTYSWSFQTYTDTSLGCPQPGKSYAQQKIQAYDIQILYGANTYDFRANLDGSGLILCGGVGGALAPTANTGAALVVGGKAQVMNAATLVQDPSNPTAVGQLAKGDVVDIVGGPTDNGGVRWWQVKTAAGVTGWSPESGAIDTGLVVILNPISGTAPTVAPIVSPTVAPTVPVAPPAAPSGATLVVGGKAQVANAVTLVSDLTHPTVAGQLSKGDIVDIVGGPTDNGGVRWWRVKTAAGVIGWSPESGATDSGLVVILNPIIGSAPTTIPVASVPTSVPAPATGSALSASTLSSPLAFVGPDGNVGMLNPGQPSALVTGDANGKTSLSPLVYTTAKQYINLRWSPDGSKLLYMEQPRTDINSIVYMVAAGQAPVVVARNANAGYPSAWSPDGTKIAWAVSTPDHRPINGADGAVIQVQAAPVSGNTVGAPQYAGTFVQGVGCGGGYDAYDVALYFREVGFETLTLDWTTQGFIHSTACNGQGLTLTDPSGKDLWSIADAGVLAASKDLSRGVARVVSNTDNSLLSIDLNNGTSTKLPLSVKPDKVEISPDGKTVIFSANTNQQMVNGNAGSTVGPQIFGSMWPPQATIVTNTLYAMPISGGTPVQLFQANGYSFGVIAVSPDNATVVFSFVPSLGTMINLINQGAPADQAIAQLPKTTLYAIPVSGGAPATPLGSAGQPAFGQGAFQVAGVQVNAPVPTVVQSAPTALPNSSGVTPPALVVGGNAVVSTTGTTLNVRKSASRTAQVVRLLNPGAVVNIMSGPVSAEGFRWWQVKTDDGSTGWVVDQFTDQDGTANTLTPQ